MVRSVIGSYFLFCFYFQNSSGAGAVVYITGGPSFRLTMRLELLNYLLFTLHGQFCRLSLTLHRTNPGIWYNAEHYYATVFISTVLSSSGVALWSCAVRLDLWDRFVPPLPVFPLFTAGDEGPGDEAWSRLITTLPGWGRSCFHGHDNLLN